MNFGKIAWISVLTAWVLATLYGALLATSAGNAESQDFGQLLTSFVKKISTTENSSSPRKPRNRCILNFR